jgi:hypothetical protein
MRNPRSGRGFTWCATKKYRAVSDTDSTHSAAQTRIQQGESAEMAAVLFCMGLLAETADDSFPQLVLYIFKSAPTVGNYLQAPVVGRRPGT